MATPDTRGHRAQPPAGQGERGNEGRPVTRAAQGRWWRIERLDGPAESCRRLLDIGLTPGEDIAVVQVVPLGGAVVVMVRGTRLALRREEAEWVRVR
jgi:ferrous iron transport protein A